MFLCAGIGVRLEYRNDLLPLCHILCRRNCGGKLSRVMRIIYINGSAARLALIFKPTERTRKIRYISADLLVRNVAKIADSKRRERIIYIMVTGDAQLRPAAGAGACIYIK